MGRHLALLFIFGVASATFSSSLSYAGLVIGITGTNASNVVASSVAGTGVNFYYSNPSGTSTDSVNWTPGTGTAGSCSAASFQVNPNCRDSTQNFYFQAADSVPTSGASTMYIKYIPTTGTAPTTGTSISLIGTTMVSVPYTANNPITFTTLHFGDLCNILNGNNVAISPQCVPTGDASVPISGTFYVIADANGDGIYSSGEDLQTFTFTVQSQIPINSSISGQTGFYSFQTLPRDGQVEIVQPAAMGVTNGAYAINFYYITSPHDVYSSTFNSTAPADFATINTANMEPTASTQFFQILLNSDGTLGSQFITNLTNGTNYYFRASVVDPAGNIGYMTPASDDLPTAPLPAPFQWHAAKPEQIAGLLSKNGKCFVATAAYGTPMAKQVQILREFRDKILMQTKSGQSFVYWYYKNGSQLADKIKDREGARAVVRTLLYPLIGYGWLALKIGAFNAALVFTMLLMFPLLALQRKRLKKYTEKIS